MRRALHFLGLCVIGSLWLSACQPEELPLIESPTEVLIPATATATSAPIIPTSTIEPASLPQDLFTPSPEETNAVTIEYTTADGEVLQLDPVSAELVALAQSQLADELDLPITRIRLVSIESYEWTDSSLGCPVEGQMYSQILADGYRVVLQAGDVEYLYHTDFTRVAACDFENEQLPTRLEVTPEVTAELTSEA